MKPTNVLIVGRLLRGLLPVVVVSLVLPLVHGQVAAGNPQTGGISGTLTKPAGSATPIEGIKVTNLETGQAVFTDAHGQFHFTDVKPGKDTLVATGEGYSRLRITDVVVQAGQDVTISPKEMPIYKSGSLLLADEEMQVSATGEEVQVMEKYLVNDEGVQPYVGTNNIDIPRTINDVQPYYMWDNAAIVNSAATSVQQFLNEMVPQVVNKGNQQQTLSTVFGATTFFTIGGPISGGGQVPVTTLILVDGRRMPNINGLSAIPESGSVGEPDLNGIPVAAIDHIEILDASASAIYGPSAAGGVINIVTKHDYIGTDVSMSYTNTTGSDSPIRNYTITSGMAFNGGKTSIIISASYQDEKDPTGADRIAMMSRNINEFNQVYYGLADQGGVDSNGNPLNPNAPLYLGGGGLNARLNLTGTSPSTLNTLPVIKTSSGAPLFAGNSATYVQVPVGYQSVAINGLAPLMANLGKPVDASMPIARSGSNFWPVGAREPMLEEPKDRSFSINIRQQLLPHLEGYFIYQYTSDVSYQVLDLSGQVQSFGTPATVPWNPFGQSVLIGGVQNTNEGDSWSNDSSHTVDLGLKADLPFNWSADLDYSWGYAGISQFSNQGVYPFAYTAAQTATTPNPIRDLLANPMPIYSLFRNQGWPATSNDLNLRMSGPLMKIWSGTPTLTVALEHIQQGEETGYTYVTSGPDSVGVPQINQTYQQVVYPGGRTGDDRVGAELEIPLISKSNHIPGVQDLSAELAFSEDAPNERVQSPNSISTTTTINQFLNTTTKTTSPNYTGTTIPETPALNYGHNTSTNSTIGFKYTPVDGITLRWDYSQAVIPPSFAELQAPVSAGTSNQTNGSQVYPGVPQSGPWPYSTISDTVLGATYAVPTVNGGSTTLGPETSHNIGYGVILTPTWGFLKGLRFSMDYDTTAISNYIVKPSSTQVFQTPSLSYLLIRGVPNAGQTVGPVILFNDQFVNITNNLEQEIDWQLQYTLRTRALGTWQLTASGTEVQHFKQQVAPGNQQVEYESNPNPIPLYTSAGPTSAATIANDYGSVVNFSTAKCRLNGEINWSKGPWAAGWTVRYIGPYCDGSFYSGLGEDPVELDPNGWVSGQIYHDFYVGYTFPKSRKGDAFWTDCLANTTLRFGMKNAFNAWPPFDGFGATGYMSPYGDIRLQQYWFSARKSF